MTSLSRAPLVIAVLASGSRGNTTYVGDGRHGVLIDCGLSTRQIVARMRSVGLGEAPVDAVLITHEHTDHVAAARVLSDRLAKGRANPVPFYMTPGTAGALDRRCRPERIERVRPGDSFAVGGLEVAAHRVPHDATDTVCWTVATARARMAQITDLGRPTRALEAVLASVDAAVVEFNHDEHLLMNGSYPWSLKQRVRGPRGHLSNGQAADLVSAALRDAPLRALVLAHLSQENNLPDKALAAAHGALKRARRDDVRVTAANQDIPVVVEVKPPLRAVPKPPRPTPTQMALFA